MPSVATVQKEKVSMPVYTYRCENCGVQFERQQSFQDAPLKTCPECRKKALKILGTGAGIIFKGSGFYANDHKSPSGSVSRTGKSESKKDTPASDSAE